MEISGNFDTGDMIIEVEEAMFRFDGKPVIKIIITEEIIDFLGDIDNEGVLFIG